MGDLTKKILAGLAVILIMTSVFVGSKKHRQFIPNPKQTGMEIQTISIEGKKGAVDIQLKAEYSISAILKSKKRYIADYASQVSPYDLALVWGDMGKEDIDKNISYRQSGRWYFTNMTSKIPVDYNYVTLHSANNHIIPKNKQILKQIKGIKKNDYITLEGYLVNVMFTETHPWSSSITRSDTGNGACEIMYVTKVKINKKQK